MSAPSYIDVTGRIPRVRESTIARRAAGEITDQVIHYLAGPHIPAGMTQEGEVAQLVSLARFHHTRDFGGGQTGRTLEYTYAVALSGRVYLLNPEWMVTWSHRAGNRVGLATVLLIGTGQEPSEPMLATLRAHLDHVAQRADVNVLRQRTWGHGETPRVHGGGPGWGNNTACPGQALGWVRRYREEAGVPPQSQTDPTNRFFPETGHNLKRGMRAHWEAHGGLGRFGYPLTEEQAGANYPFSVLPELAGWTCQLFERALLLYRDGAGVHEDARVGALAMALAGEAQRRCSCE